MTHALNSANIITFVHDDPLSAGFAVARQSGDAAILAVANTPTSAGKVAAGQIAKSDFDDLIASAEFGNLTGPQLTSLGYLTQDGTINIGSATTQGKLAVILSGLTLSAAAVAAAGQRNASPAEVYFGAGTVLVQQQIDDARNSVAGNNF